MFICRILNWLRLVHGKRSAQLISSFVKKDLIWWSLFLPSFNGVSMMLVEEWSVPDEILSCDACPSGCGGIMNTSYFHEQFLPFIKQQQLHINALELLTVVVALKLWGQNLRGKKVLIFCDNMSSCRLINQGVSKDEFHQSCLREICFVAAVNEFSIKAQHIRGVDNRVSDTLSRWLLNDNSEKLFSECLDTRSCSRVL